MLLFIIFKTIYWIINKLFKLIFFIQGLGEYGSASESSDENDEEQQLSGHKQSFSQDSTEVIQVKKFIFNIKRKPKLKSIYN